MINKYINKRLEEKNISDNNLKRYVVTKNSSLLGIFSNLGLFIVKLSLGLIVKSVSVISDAFNNLSDCLSFVISLVGLHYSNKPADKEHPFGHGRVEYIVSFIVTILIFVAGFEFLSESYKRIINPSALNTSLLTVIILIITMLVKVFLSIFLDKAGNEIDSLVLKASSKDSRNDVLITGVVLLALIFYMFNKSIPFDGIAGIIVSLFIFFSGYDLAKSTITRLLGSQVDEEVLNDIKEVLLENENVYGVHDLIVHDYGPSVKMGSGHVEMSNKLSLDEAHRIIDKVETEINDKFGVDFTIHIDPVNIGDEEYERFYKKLEKVIANINKELAFHDLSVNNDTKEVSFDVEVPFGLNITNEEIENIIKKEFSDYKIQLTIDRGYTVVRS